MKSDFDLNQQTQSTESKIVASLERISQAFRVLLWEESKEHSLSPIQIQVLIFLLFHSTEKRKISYLANEFNMTKATISDTVKTLENKELISKVHDLEDNRSYTIHLTTKGKEVAENTAGFTKEIQESINQLEAYEKENLLFSLLNIIRHLNNVQIINIQRMCMSCLHYHASNDGQKHYCKLLNQELKKSELRIDCLEHELKA